MSVLPFSPNTTVKLYRGVNFDPSYKNIRWFTSKSSQQSYLASKLYNTWNNVTVVREKSSVKLTGEFNNSINCDYISFQNPANLGNASPIIYGFIKSIEYTNNNTIEVFFDIDWIQSFITEIKFDTCFVEREHVNDDTVGINTIEENLPIGEYYCNYHVEKHYTPAMLAWIAPDISAGGTYGNVPQCLMGQGYAINAVGALNDLLVLYKEQPERVPLVTTCVQNMLNSGGAPITFTDSMEGFEPSLTFGFNNAFYQAKNNKLKCYPYQMFIVDNNSGQCEQYHYEDFTGEIYHFNIYGTPSPKPVISCTPTSYKGQTNVWSEQITYSAFPLVGWINNSYHAYMSQYMSQALSVVGATTAVISGDMTKIANIATGLVGMEETQRQNKLHSLQYNGGTTEGALPFAENRIGFDVYGFKIRADAAKSIDEFFTRFGYRVNRVKKPNVTGRTKLNYVKCSDSHVHGNVPIQTIETMQNALNSGTTFWHINITSDTITDNDIIGG